MQHFKFLIVESDPQINFLTSQIIELDNIPIKAHFEKNPLKALQYLETLDRNQFPDVVLVSNMMSFMTGLEFTEDYIRQFYHFNPDTLIYITGSYCSMDAMAKIIATAELAGFLSQPFSKKTFLDRIVPNINVSVV